MQRRGRHAAGHLPDANPQRTKILVRKQPVGMEGQRFDERTAGFHQVGSLPADDPDMMCQQPNDLCHAIQPRLQAILRVFLRIGGRRGHGALRLFASQQLFIGGGIGSIAAEQQMVA